jgi:hypothetical protein
MRCRTPAWTSLDANILAPRRRTDILEDVLDAEGVLYDPRTGRTSRLNQTALAVWRSCDGISTTRQIAERLTEQYDVTPERALDHVEQLLLLFAEGGLLDAEVRA